MARTQFENLQVYRLAEDLADRIWDVVAPWKNFAKDTVGKQLVRAADSIGANIAEGSGRGAFQDNRRFVRIARASLHETKHWLRRAYKRGLLEIHETEALKTILDELAPLLNAYLRSIGPAAAVPRPTYNGPLTTDN
jgi:four helix bundle protein